MPAPLFILCPGRSFSSVVSSMIGQHPQAYGLPELNLFLGPTLGTSSELYGATGRKEMVGLKRVLAQLHDGVQTFETVARAEVWITDHAAMTGKEVYAHLQTLLPDRLLVEKSPTNVISDGAVNRMLQAFPEASYLQLLRHPRSQGKSQAEAMKKQQMVRFLAKVSGGVDYETPWSTSHRRIHNLGRALPCGQLLRLRGEDFLRDPRLYLPQICAWLGLSPAPDAIGAMLHPEASPYSCLGPSNARTGANPGFLENPTLDLDRMAAMVTPTLDAPMDWNPARNFSDMTRELAGWYGYR